MKLSFVFAGKITALMCRFVYSKVTMGQQSYYVFFPYADTEKQNGFPEKQGAAPQKQDGTL